MPALAQFGALVAASVIPAATALRKSRHSSRVSVVGGVRVHNYEARKPDGETLWTLMLQKGVDVDDICSQIECKARGHTKGVPFVELGASEDKFTGFLKAHTDEISFAEPAVEYFVPEDDLVAPSDAASSGEMWHLDRVGRSSFTGSGVHIYVMDTGVRSTHQDFGGRAVPTVDTNPTSASGGAVTECNGDVTCGTDYHGHGTHVAGTAGGTNYGVAPQAILHVMKVCCGPGTNTLGAMDWIASNAVRPAIMTVSLGSRTVSEAALIAVNQVVDAGITVTVAAANDNVDTCTMTYGYIPAAISVGATDSTDTRAWFSNYGPCNDIYAPGVAIFSAWNNADDGTRTISGTSMATPMVAGASALLLEQNPAMAPAKVNERLREMSIKGVISDLQAGDPDMLLSVV